MSDEDKQRHAGVGPMHKRRAALEDGRYIIYYTFGEEAQADGEAARKREPPAEAVAEEGRGV